MGTAYNNEFQDQHLAGSLASAAVVLPILFEFYEPKSIVDIGCGLGAWLKSARDLGVQNLLGLDGNYIDRKKLLINPDHFRAADLTERIVVERRFDLAISAEVAEHLSYSRSESFVADLTRLSDVILFSAATPYQGGTNHINEQWLEFWGILFRRFGYVACDVLRPRIWGNPAVEFWYRQNLIVFCRAEAASAIFPAGAVITERALSIMHPMTMLINAARYRPLMQEARELECLDYVAVVQAYLSGEITVPPLKIMEALAADQTRMFPEARVRVCDAAAEIAMLRTDHERLLREAEDRSRSLTKELEIRGNEIARLNTALTDLHADIAGRNADVASLNADIAGLNGGIAGLHAEVADLHADLAGRNADIAGLNSEIVMLNTGLTTLQDRVARMGIALAARNCEVLSNRQTTMWKMAMRLQALRSLVSAKARIERDVRLVAMSGLFDRDYYISQTPRLEQLGLNPVYHYVEYGAADGLDPHPLFDTSFYLTSYPDVTRSRMNPLAHYHAKGGAEGMDPHPSFKTQAYLAKNPEVLQAGMTPLLHYLVFSSPCGEDLP